MITFLRVDFMASHFVPLDGTKFYPIQKSEIS